MNLMVSAEPMLLAETLEKLQRLWDLELLGIKKTEEVLLTKEEFEAQRLQDQVTHYDPQQKTWVTSLLFKERPPKVGSNKKKALGILQKVEKSTIQKGVVDEVNVAYEEYITKGYSEEVLEDYEPAEVHYLPAHAVFKDDSASLKTRIVFNASAISETGKLLTEPVSLSRTMSSPRDCPYSHQVSTDDHRVCNGHQQDVLAHHIGSWKRLPQIFLA